MAKSNQQMTLDNELIERLRKEPNKSGLMNDLLLEYYSIQDSKSKEAINKKIKNNKIQIKELQKENKQLQTQMKKIIKKNIEIKHSQQEMDKKKKLIQDRRARERHRAGEFEQYVKKNNLKLNKLDFHTLMHKFSEETKDSITKFMSEHKGI